MIFCEESLDEFDAVLLENIAQSLTSKNIELVLVDSEKMREINKTQRQIDKSTDVLSFPLVQLEFGEDFSKNLGENFNLGENLNSNSNEFSLLGSIVINLDAVNSGAREFKHSESAEFALLFLHGLLHLLGFNHEKDNGEMREKESEIIAKFNLPKSLIVRNLG